MTAETIYEMLHKMQEMLGQYLDYLLLEKGLAELSCEAYRCDIERFGDYLNGENLTPDKLKQPDLTRFLEYLRNEGLAPSSIARHLSSIKGFYRYMRKIGKLDKDPTQSVIGPKIYRAHPGALSVEEVFKLLEAPFKTRRKGAANLVLRDSALLEFLYGSGARVSEAVSVKKSDLYKEMNLVKLYGKGNKERVVPLGKAAWVAVDNYLEGCRSKLAHSQSGDYLFLNNRGGKLSRMGVWKILAKHVVLAGITKRVSPHTLRHSFATHLLAGGADLVVVQELLGHADITTTEVYTHLDREFLISEHREFHPREKW